MERLGVPLIIWMHLLRQHSKVTMFFGLFSNTAWILCLIVANLWCSSIHISSSCLNQQLEFCDGSFSTTYTTHLLLKRKFKGFFGELSAFHLERNQETMALISRKRTLIWIIGGKTKEEHDKNLDVFIKVAITFRLQLMTRNVPSQNNKSKADNWQKLVSKKKKRSNPCIKQDSRPVSPASFGNPVNTADYSHHEMFRTSSIIL